MGELPCTEEQTAAFEAGFEEAAAYYAELGTGFAEETDISALADYIWEYESLDSEFSDAYGEIICSETFNPALGISSVFTDSLTVVLLSRIALIESEMGDAEVAQYFADQATARAEILQATAANIIGE